MEARVKKLLWLLVPCMLMLASCGRTVISVEPESKNYSIYVNGKMAGTGTAKITKRGLPQSAFIEVKDQAGNTLATEAIKRKFVFNIYTVLDLLYWPALITNFEYKKAYTIIVPYREGQKSRWDTDTLSAWD